MDFSIIVHNGSGKNIKESDNEILVSSENIYLNLIDAGDEYNVLKKIFTNASNINFISESREGNFIINDGILDCCFETKSGVKIYLSYDQRIPWYMECYCDHFSDVFIDEIIKATGEYYDMNFEYYEINITGNKGNVVMSLHLYENEDKAKNITQGN